MIPLYSFLHIQYLTFQLPVYYILLCTSCISVVKYCFLIFLKNSYNTPCYMLELYTVSPAVEITSYLTEKSNTV